MPNLGQYFMDILPELRWVGYYLDRHEICYVFKVNVPLDFPIGLFGFRLT